MAKQEDILRPDSQKQADTSVAKHMFNHGGEPLTADNLAKILGTTVDRLPKGDLAGIVVLDGPRVLGAVRSRELIPTKTHHDGTAEFGGKPTTAHIELNLAEIVGIERAARIAAGTVRDAREGRAPTFGIELEAWAHRPNGALAELPKSEQIELQCCLHERALAPVKTLEQMALLRSGGILHRHEQMPNLTIVDTSSPLTGSLSDPGVKQNNSSGEAEAYVEAMATILRSHMDGRDPYARQIADRMARSAGYKNFDTMRDSLPQIGYWLAAASHVSVGLPHIERDGKYSVPLEIGIAVADTFNSQLATVAELLTYSSPLFLGEATTIVDGNGKGHQLRDTRAALRYIMATTYPSQPIRDVPTLLQRWQTAIANGHVNTLDRASYLSENPGIDGNPPETYPGMHTRERLRVATSTLVADPKNQVGRVEFTGKGATPSMLDALASDVLVRLFAISGQEAVAAGMHPYEYFADKFPGLATHENQRELAEAYNIYGASHPQIRALLEECDRYLEYMWENYPGLRREITFARIRVQNMQLPPEANDLHEYLRNPKGSFSEVVIRMHEKGMSVQEILEEIAWYEHESSMELIKARGDVYQLLGRPSRRD